MRIRTFGTILLTLNTFIHLQIAEAAEMKKAPIDNLTPKS